MDGTEGRILGASFGDGPSFVSLRDPEATKSLLVVPGTVLRYDREKKKARTLRISNVVVNAYLDETLFSPGGTP